MPTADPGYSQQSTPNTDLQPELDANSLENRVRFTCSWDGLVFNT
jgi:hypothetical protein